MQPYKSQIHLLEMPLIRSITHTHTHLIPSAATHFFPPLQAKCKCFPDIKVYKSHQWHGAQHYNGVPRAAESSRAEISAASPGYQRETSFCKFISHCEQASQLVNGAARTTALFAHSFQSAHRTPSTSHRSPLQLAAALVLAIKDEGELISCAHTRRTDRHLNMLKSVIHSLSGAIAAHSILGTLFDFFLFLSFYSITLH